MKRSFRLAFSIFLSCLLIHPPTLARTSDLSDLKALSASEKVADLYELLKPNRRDETLSEVFYRMSVRLDAEELNYLAKKLDSQGHLKAPKVERQGQDIVISEGNRRLTITYVENKGEPEIRVNGRALSSAHIKSPSLRWALLERVLAKSNSKSAQHPLLLMLLPESAEALGWMGILAIGATALGAYILFKKQSAGNQVKCAAPAPTCCLVNGAYTMHSSGCCQEIGGFGIGSSTCPANPVDPNAAQIPAQTPATSSGQR